MSARRIVRTLWVINCDACGLFLAEASALRHAISDARNAGHQTAIIASTADWDEPLVNAFCAECVEHERNGGRP